VEMVNNYLSLPRVLLNVESTGFEKKQITIGLIKIIDTFAAVSSEE